MADTKITDLTADANPSGDDLVITVNDPGGTPANRKATVTNLSKGIDHDQTVNFASDEHVAHSGVTLTAGSGLAGGGDISASRQFDVDINSESGKTAPVSADELLLSDSEDSNAIAKVTLANVTKGLDPNGLTDKAAPVAADELIIADSEASNAIKKADAQSVVAGTTALLEGLQTLWVPANAMTPATTSGAATGQTETSSNDVNFETLDFDASADEYACFSVAFPKSWNAGTITFQAFWASTAADTDGVAWGLQAVAFAEDDALDTAYGTAVVVTDDASGTALDLMVSAVSSAVTIAGSPAADELVNFRLFRDVSDGNDDMTEDALLIGIKIFYTINAANDA